MYPDVLKQISTIKDWTRITIKKAKYEIASVPFTAFCNAAKKYKTKPIQCRLVVTRQKRRDGQLNLITGQSYDYQATLTNDFVIPQKAILQFYNQRGKQEKEFDVMNNDFGWKNMPFSKLNENLVYLILTAMCRNVYCYILRLFSNQLTYLNPSFRIKKFIFRFVIVAAKWVKNGRQRKLRLYTQKAYPT